MLFTATSAGIGGALPWAETRAATNGQRDAATAGNVAGFYRAHDQATVRLLFGGDEDPYDSVTTYTNFYEFSTHKSDPAEDAHTLTPRRGRWGSSARSHICGA